MARVGLMLLLLLVAGCTAGDGSGQEAAETTAASEGPRELRVDRLFSGEPGQGPRRPRVILAPSASGLSGATGADVPGSGDGTYLAAYWGQKPTGGYSMAVKSARLEGSAVTVRVSLKEPPRDAIVTQALTHPYAVAVIRDLDPEGKNFIFVDEEGRELGWPVRRTGE
jgi:hypothetical protein